LKPASVVAALTLLICLIPTLTVSASADEPHYNFASAQGEKRILVAPGGEGRGVLYFYNIDGNRITHVTLTSSSLPPGWQVSLDPPLHETPYSVNGEAVTTAENFAVEPSDLLVHAATSTPPGSACIAVPGRGFALAKEANVVVRAPSDTPPGTKAQLRVSAEAAWLGQIGVASLKQARDFDFTVEVAQPSAGHTEHPLPAAATAAAPAGSAAADEGQFALWLPLAALGMVMMAGAGYAAGRRGRHGDGR
jgi:hypothetical protein